MQAISGAGYPGVASMDIIANVIPFIGGEEEKMQQETQKILGDFRGDHIEPLAAKVSAHCNRVPVVDGHTVAVSVEFAKKPSRGRSAPARFESFRGVPQERELPSAPPRPVIYMHEAGPSAAAHGRRARERHGGLRRTAARVPGARSTSSSRCGHNTIRGAAGAAVLNAELMQSEGIARLNDRHEIRRHVGRIAPQPSSGVAGIVKARGAAPAGGGGLGHGQDHQQAAGDRRSSQRRHGATSTSAQLHDLRDFHLARGSAGGAAGRARRTRPLRLDEHFRGARRTGEGLAVAGRTDAALDRRHFELSASGSRACVVTLALPRTSACRRCTSIRAA